ncbi:ImmA/IrrE family metallo-endopeptidase [Lysinibacillus sp. FSL K6-0075]|uniref:ImmA/IrrE family metallo-endopeptidase n=1 Tax=Lysinibacillus sp. FSL K6-0075 TaxID=2921415 RepID=UPI0031582C48
MIYNGHTENFIKKMYMNLGITNSKQLDFKNIAQMLTIQIFYWNRPSQALFDEYRAFILLNEQLTPSQLWQDFCHELGHILLHTGQQHQMTNSWIKYLENKANNFMYHACMPTFMLDDLIENDSSLSVKDLQLIFNVEYEFAEKRLTQYFNNKNMPKWNSAFLLYF